MDADMGLFGQRRRRLCFCSFARYEPPYIPKFA